jgi:hypothetical protein
MAIIKINNNAIDLDAAEIPNLDASKITTGSLGTDRIPNLDASKITTGTITPSDGTVTTDKIVDANVTLAKLSATGTKDATTFLRGDNTFASAGGTNTPAFHAYATGGRQTVGHATYTKVTMTAESFDTDSAFDNVTNYRFTVPSGKGGKYFIYWSVGVFFGSNNGFDLAGAIFKNGSQFTDETNAATYPTGLARHLKSMNSGMFDLSAGDYLEVFVKHQNNGSSSEGVDNATVFGSGATWGVTYFGGYKIIE